MIVGIIEAVVVAACAVGAYAERAKLKADLEAKAVESYATLRSAIKAEVAKVIADAKAELAKVDASVKVDVNHLVDAIEANIKKVL
jgi:hypothetical protein